MSDDDRPKLLTLRSKDYGRSPVFVVTRVPLQNMDCLEVGESVEDSLQAFPTVRRDQVTAVIEANDLGALG